MDRASQPGGDEKPRFLRDAELSGFGRAALSVRVSLDPIPLFRPWTVLGGMMERARVVGTEAPNLVMCPSFHTAVGLDPWRNDFVFAESFFVFRPFFEAMNRLALDVRTQRSTDLDAAIHEIPWANPVRPGDPVED